LIERNIATNKIHFELFNAPKVNGKKAASLASASGVATIKIDGLSFEVPIPKGMNVLDAAHLKGADLPYACKGGVCCTCRAKLTEGSVDMEVNFALTEEELEAGFILTCQAHPKTAHITVDFDIK
jgi:ring-1,2-phenylacetyl-CoA epoxidase subunit PaaE